MNKFAKKEKKKEKNNQKKKKKSGTNKSKAWLFVKMNKIEQSRISGKSDQWKKREYIKI